MHARPRHLVLTHSVMLDFTVKSENIGAVTCSASRRTSADRCQNLRFGDTNFRLCVLNRDVGLGDSVVVKTKAGSNPFSNVVFFPSLFLVDRAH